MTSITLRNHPLDGQDCITFAMEARDLGERLVDAMTYGVTRAGWDERQNREVARLAAHAAHLARLATGQCRVLVIWQTQAQAQLDGAAS